eukprot:COSAG02_NODE_1839_length_10707_cov_7.098793_10_plen_146_part_00
MSAEEPPLHEAVPDPTTLALATVCELGFTPEVASVALAASGNDIQQAVNSLLQAQQALATAAAEPEPEPQPTEPEPEPQPTEPEPAPEPEPQPAEPEPQPAEPDPNLAKALAGITDLTTRTKLNLDWKRIAQDYKPATVPDDGRL